MAPTYVDPPFAVAEHGFQFANRFSNAVYLGAFGWSIRTRGRCGGMCYAALDHFEASVPRPAGDELPPDGDVLADYIFRRQLDSFLLAGPHFIAGIIPPGGSTHYYRHSLPLGGASYREVVAAIDRGEPQNLGLLKLGGSGFGHQVLAIGYTADAHRPLIHVYDPNFPGAEKVLWHDPNQRAWCLADYDDDSEAVGTTREVYKAYFPDRGYRFRQPDYAAGESPGAHDLSYRDLRAWQPPAHQDLQGYRFVGSRFSDSDLLGSCDLEGVDARQAIFDGARLHACDMRDMQLARARFDGADLRSTTLDGARVEEASFADCDLSDASLERTFGDDVVLHRARLNNTRMRKSFLKGVAFYRAIVANSRLDESVLADADFRYTTLDNVAFNACELTNGSFRHASVKSCDFREAKLERADFDRASIHQGTFEGGNCYRARFTGASLHGVVLDGADLGRADFSDAHLDAVYLREIDAQRFAGSDWHGARLSHTGGLSQELEAHILSRGGVIV